MSLPTITSIRSAPFETLPEVLHRTRAGGMRAHTSAARLATLIASGQVTVTRTEVAVSADIRLPPRVGAESDDHRLMRAAGRNLVLACDPSALTGMEVALSSAGMKRRFDGFAVTRYGAEHSGGYFADE